MISDVIMVGLWSRTWKKFIVLNQYNLEMIPASNLSWTSFGCSTAYICHYIFRNLQKPICRVVFSVSRNRLFGVACFNRCYNRPVNCLFLSLRIESLICQAVQTNQFWMILVCQHDLHQNLWRKYLLDKHRNCWRFCLEAILTPVVNCHSPEMCA